MRPPLGQHFLRDPRVIQTILAAADLASHESALEIGPGKGVLTEALLPRVRHLTVIELDRQLAAALESRWGDQASLRIVQGDFLKQDLDALIRPPQPVKVLGNLPYSITSPIFEKLLAWPRWEVGVFLIQKEVADRIQSGPGSRVFGILSLAVQLFAHAETILSVKPGAFIPPPRVMSAVIRLRRRTAPLLPETTLPAFFDLIHGAFAHRRKTIANSLAFHSDAPRERVEDWLEGQHVLPSARAETLGLPVYVQMAEAWAIFRRETNLTTGTATSTIAPRKN